MNEKNFEPNFVEFLQNQIEELKQKNKELELLLLEYERAIDSSSSYKTLMEVAQDLIELRRAQAALKKERDYFKNVLDNSADAIGIVDAKGRFIRWNKRAEELFGFSFEELKGKSAFDLYEDKKTLDKMLTELRKKGYVRDFEIEVRTKSGRFLPMGMSISVLKEDGKVIGSVCVARDLSQIKQAQMELKRSKEEAEAASRAKSEFLANMSHEIRTPMNAILGFTETLLSETTNERHRRFLETILQSGRNLLALIDDILDLSKIEAGKLKLQPEPMDIKAVIYEIRSIFMEEAKRKGLKFTVDISPYVSEILILDDVRIRQILTNLVSNAIKFTEKGKVTIYLSQIIKAKDKVDVIIKVADTGIGIPKSQQEVVFENFRQQDNQKTKKYGGTGLGLAITKKLVELMGGEILLESEEGKGSIFTVILPNVKVGENQVKRNTKDFQEEGTVIQFKDSSVLIVDDISYNIEVVENLLKDTKINIFGATNVKEANSILENNDIKLIFMDIRMPDIDGISFTKKLRQEQRFRDIPIIALTAMNIKDKLDEINKYFQGYILKPLDKKQLISILKNFLPWEYTKKSHVKEDNLDFSKVSKEVIEEIKTNISPIIDEIEGVIELDSMKIIADILMEIGKKYNDDTICNLSQRILHYINSFNIAQIKDIITFLKNHFCVAEIS